jgi:hypothetical protein
LELPVFSQPLKEIKTGTSNSTKSETTVFTSANTSNFTQRINKKNKTGTSNFPKLELPVFLEKLNLSFRATRIETKLEVEDQYPKDK